MNESPRDDSAQTDAKLMALYGLLTGLVMAAEKRGIAHELLEEAVEMADTQALKFHSLPQFASQGGQVLNEIEELRQFLVNGLDEAP